MSARSWLRYSSRRALTILRRVGRGAHREGRHGGQGMYVRNLTIPARIAGGRRGERERSERVRSAWRVAGGVSFYARGFASA